jgi:hypothetical protein
MEFEKLARLAQARNTEAKARIRRDDFASISAADRILALELMDLLGIAEKLIEDVKVLVVSRRPPTFAEYALYLVLDKEEREVLIGDLVEEYNYIKERFGKRKADLWFHKQVIWSLWPFMRRMAMRCAAFVWVGRVLRRLTSW